jgi:hypothetical protein
MSRPEGFATGWLILTDFHIGIPETDNLFLSVFTSFDTEFLPALDVADWLVTGHPIFQVFYGSHS